MSRPHVVTSAELQSLRDLELVTKATVEGLATGSASQSVPRLQRGVQPVSALSPRRRSEVRRLEGVRANGSDLHAPVSRDDQPVRAVRRRHQPVDGLSRDRERDRDRRSKFELARSVAAILGTLVLDQGDAAGVLARRRSRAFRAAAKRASSPARVPVGARRRSRPRGSSSIAEALRRAATILKRRGLVIVVSDLYEDEAAIGQVRRLARMGHDVIVDAHAGARGADARCRRRRGVRRSRERPQAAWCSRRRRAMPTSPRSPSWLTTIEQQLRRDGIDYLRLIAGEPLEPALRRFLVTRRGVVVVMSVSWITPAALDRPRAGRAADRDSPAGAPARARARVSVAALPSETQLAALRRRSIQDAALLMCRIAIIAIAALALAGPVLQTPAQNGESCESHVARDRHDRRARSVRDRHGCRGRICIGDVHAADRGRCACRCGPLARSTAALGAGDRHHRRLAPRRDRRERSGGRAAADRHSIRSCRDVCRSRSRRCRSWPGATGR